MTVNQFANLLESKQPSHSAPGEQKILETLSTEVAGAPAIARVRDAYLGLMFLDTLSLVEVDWQCSIYNKLYHVEGEVT
ncbi:MAG: hypothetical protein ACJAX5_001046 [Patiriisocius sp.]|jgi:hypothetical protein